MTLMFKWADGSEHDFDALPEASKQGLVNRAIAHVAGNEVASQIVAYIRTQIVAGTENKAGDAQSPNKPHTKVHSQPALFPLSAAS